MTITVSTAKFELRYGRKPRGVGLWYFEAAGKEFSHAGPYSEAKRAAVRWARDSGADSVKVIWRMLIVSKADAVPI